MAKNNKKSKKKNNNQKRVNKNIKNSSNTKTTKKVNNPKEHKKKVIKVEDLRVKRDVKLPKLNNKTNTKSKAKTIAKRKKKKNNYLKKVNKLYRKIKIYGIQSVIPLKNIVSLGLALFAFIMVLLLLSMIINRFSYIDLDLIPSKIDQLTTMSLNINDAENIIISSNAYTNDPNGRLPIDFKIYYEYDFEKVFKLDKNLIQEHYIRFNKMNGNTFVIIKAKDSNKDKIKEIFDNFFKSMNNTQYEYLDYQGYQIFINSSNNVDVISKIKQSQTRVFNIFNKELNKNDINEVLKIKDTWYKKALVKTPMIVKSDTCGYMIFKPRNKSAKKKIINAMNNYYEQLENKWKDTNDENYQLVINRHFEEYHGYLIYVVSHDNNLAMELIKN